MFRALIVFLTLISLTPLPAEAKSSCAKAFKVSKITKMREAFKRARRSWAKTPAKVFLREYERIARDTLIVGGFAKTLYIGNKKGVKAVYWVFHPLQAGFYIFSRGGRLLRLITGQNIYEYESLLAGRTLSFDTIVVPNVIEGIRINLYDPGQAKTIGLIKKAVDRFRKPSKRYGRRHFWAKEHLFSSLAAFVVTGTLFTGAYAGFSAGFDHFLGEKQRAIVHQHTETWMTEVQRDPFLARVKAKWERGRVGLEGEALAEFERKMGEEAFVRLHGEAVYRLREELGFGSREEATDSLLEDPIVRANFPATSFLRENAPIPRLEGREQLSIPPNQMRAAETSESRTRLDDLMDVNHRYYRQRALLREMAETSTEVLRGLIQDPRYLRDFEDLVANPYIQGLLAMKASGRITQDQLISLLLEEAQFQEKFARWDLYSAERYYFEDGQRKNHTLETFRRLRLEQLAGKRKDADQIFGLDFFPTFEFDNSHLVTNVGMDLTALYVLRFAPFLKNNHRVIKTISHMSRKQAYRDNTSAKVSGATNVLVGFDVFMRQEQWFTLEKQVLRVAERPYLFEPAGERPRNSGEESILEFEGYRNDPVSNPYSDYYSTQLR